MQDERDKLKDEPEWRRVESTHPGYFVLTYYLFIVAVITLIPFDFTLNVSLAAPVLPDAFDLVSNVALFLPVGFLYAWVVSERGRPSRFAGWGIGVAISLAIELTQMTLPSRIASVTDVAANGIGAALGAALFTYISRRAFLRLANRMLVDLPLIGFLYLLTPLMWLVALSASVHPEHVWSVLFLGAAGVVVVAAVWAYRLSPKTSRWKISVAWFAWFGVASLPAVSIAPTAMASVAGVLVGLLALALIRLAANTNRERRFESVAIRWVWPLFIAYLASMGISPVPENFAFNWTAGLPEGIADRNSALLMLEHISAMTVFGFLLAESRGRIADSRSRALGVVVGAALLIGLVLEVIIGLRPDGTASGSRLLFCMGAALFGAVHYRIHMRLVRRVIGSREVERGTKAC